MSNCIVLIGMPGAGKSTVGPLLAQSLGCSFEDTDAIVRQSDGRELKKIVAEDGFEAFLDIQQEVILSHRFDHCVIATGGAVVKSETLMKQLKELGPAVYLQYEFEVLEQRLAPDRRLARAGGQSFRQVFEERVPLYERYADVILPCTGKAPEQIVEEIIGETAERRRG